MNHEKSIYASQKVGITGGTGLVGKELVKLLQQFGYQIVIFTRRKNQNVINPGITYSQWNWKNKKIDGELLRSCDFIIHLAGAGIMAKRWTFFYKRAIRNSRVRGTQLIVDTLNAGPAKTRVLIGASAVGYYGATKNILFSFKETSSHSSDFLGKVCYDWENALFAPKNSNIRTCAIRTGIVFSRTGGIFPQLKKLFHFKLVPIPGPGTQQFSWIHVADLCRVYLLCMQNEKLSGPVNACSNITSSLNEIMLRLEKLLMKNCIFLNIPPFMVRIAMGEAANEILKSTSASNSLIRYHGFVPKFISIEDCLRDLVYPSRLKVGIFKMPARKMEE